MDKGFSFRVVGVFWNKMEVTQRCECTGLFIVQLLITLCEFYLPNR